MVSMVSVVSMVGVISMVGVVVVRGEGEEGEGEEGEGELHCGGFLLSRGLCLVVGEKVVGLELGCWWIDGWDMGYLILMSMDAKHKQREYSSLYIHFQACKLLTLPYKSTDIRRIRYLILGSFSECRFRCHCLGSASEH